MVDEARRLIRDPGKMRRLGVSSCAQSGCVWLGTMDESWDGRGPDECARRAVYDDIEESKGRKIKRSRRVSETDARTASRS